MITPDYLNRIMDGVEDKLSALNEYLVKKIAKRILGAFEDEAGNLFIPSTISDMRKLMSHGVLYEDMVKAITKALPSIQKEVKQAFLESADEICKQNNDIASKIVKIEGASVNVPKYEQVGIVQEAEQLDMTPAEIRKLEMAYRRVNSEIKNLTKTTASICQRDYINACNTAYMKAQSGVSVQTAVAEAIKEVADKGIQVVGYDSGHTDRMEVAIARAVRTGINQANSEIVLQRCAEMGVNYVKVSAHIGARVTKFDDYTNHSWWQGKIYSVDWSLPELNDFKPSIQDDGGRFGWLKQMRDFLQRKKRVKYPDFVSTCGYGDVQGIAGANCKHSFYPFYPEIQIAEEDRPDLEENERRYNQEQRLRAMERAIRQTKREIEAFSVDKDKFAEELTKARKKLNKQSDAYMDFCKATGLKPRNMSLKIK